MPALSLDYLTSLDDFVSRHGYDAARAAVLLASHGSDFPYAQAAAVALLCAGFSPPEIRTMQQLAGRLRAANVRRCNGTLDEAGKTRADRDEGLAKMIATTARQIEDGVPAPPRTSVQHFEITGLPGGFQFRLKLTFTRGVGSDRVGTPIQGNHGDEVGL